MARYYDPDSVGVPDGLTWATAWTTQAAAEADCTLARGPCYVRKSGGGSIVLTATWTFATQAGAEANNQLRWIGCNAAGTVDGTRVVIDGNGGAYHMLTISQNYRSWENFAFTGMGATKYGAYVTGHYQTWQNCDFYQGSNAAYGLYGPGYHYNLYIDCRFRNFTANYYPIQTADACFVRCDFLHCVGGPQVVGSYGSCAIDCVFHGMTGPTAAAWVSQNVSAFLFGCVFDSNLAGAAIQWPRSVVVACRFTNNSGLYSVSGAAYTAYAIGCTFRNNFLDAGTMVVRLMDGPTLTSDGYVNAAAHDFRLVDTDPARSVQIGQYIPTLAYRPSGLGIKERIWPQFNAPIIGA